MGKVFFTSDLHFNHKNIIKYENRPFSNVEDMNKKLIEKWNDVVSDDDEVYIIGDFSFGDYEFTYQIAKQLKGKKYVILGNHDKSIKNMPKKLRDEVFVWVKDYYMLKYKNKKIVMFHFPIQTWDCQHYDSIHLYGHVHSNKGDYKMEYNTKNSYNVGVDVNNYFPVEFDDILSKL